MRIIKTLVLVITMLINTAAPAGSLYVNYGGDTVRCINSKEESKYEEIIETCEEAADKDYIDTFDGKEDNITFKVYYINKHYAVVVAESQEYRYTLVSKDEMIQKGIIKFRGDRTTYDLMDFATTKDVSGLNDYIK